MGESRIGKTRKVSQFTNELIEALPLSPSSSSGRKRNSVNYNLPVISGFQIKWLMFFIPHEGRGMSLIKLATSKDSE